MRRGISDVEEKGAAFPCGVSNVFERGAGDVVRHVEIFGKIFRLEQAAIFTKGAVRHGFVIVCRAAQKATGLVKAPVPRVGALLTSQMPFAGKIGAVAGFFQQFRQGRDIRIESAPVAGASVVVVQKAHVHLMRFASGHDGGAGWRAPGGRIAPGSLHALFGQGINMRGWNFGAVTAQIRPPHIIRKNQYDVGPVRVGGQLKQQ